MLTGSGSVAGYPDRTSYVDGGHYPSADQAARVRRVGFPPSIPSLWLIRPASSVVGARPRNHHVGLTRPATREAGRRDRRDTKLTVLATKHLPTTSRK